VDVFGADQRFLAQSFREAVGAVRRQLDDGPSLRLGAGQALRDHASSMLRLIGTLSTQAQTDFKSAGNDQERRAALRKLRRLVEVARDLDHVLVHLQPQTGQLGLGTAYLVLELGQALIGSPVDLIETPLDASRFATLSWPFELLLSRGPAKLQSAGQLRKRRKGPIPVLVMYPRREAANVFLAPLLIHELGHPAVERNKLIERLWSQLHNDVRAWPECLEHYLEIGTQQASAGSGQSRREAELRLRVKLEELICDALAVCCLGPSYLFAFVGHAASRSLTEALPSHPPTALRVELMLIWLESLGWGEVLSRTPQVTEWLRALVQTTAPVLRVEPELLKAMRAAGETVGQIAFAHTTTVRFTPARFAEQSEALEALLRDDILPAQVDHNGSRADRPAVILAGWIHGLGARPPSAIPKLLADGKTHSFLDKALEMSTVLEKWRASSDGP
jgi:hypothetical protein